MKHVNYLVIGSFVLSLLSGLLFAFGWLMDHAPSVSVVLAVLLVSYVTGVLTSFIRSF